MTEAELHRWLANAKPGEAVGYYRGALALDRAIGSRLGEVERRELDRVAATAMALAEAGRVHLVQHRRGNDDYEYIVVVASAFAHTAAGPRRSEAGR